MRIDRAGYTFFEMLMAFTVAATGVAMAAPKISSLVSHMRVDQAAEVTAGDLSLAASLADREHKPVRVTIDAVNHTVSVTDRGGAILSKRAYGMTSEYDLTQLSGSPASIDLFPNGTTSQALTLTLGINGFTRHVVMTRAGLVHVVIP